MKQKREWEKKIVSDMIELYCRRNHKTGEALCADCAALERYAHGRSDRCPFAETKTFCSNCQTHCYRSDMREKICTVMRFSGPRMIWYHPVAAICHLWASKLEKRKILHHAKG